MRRLILCLGAACVAVALTASAAPAKKGRGTMCVLHAKLAAKNETTGSTSVAKGHTDIKVRTDGTIEFKTKILNKNHETFFAGHVHQAPVGVAGPIVVPLFVAPSPPTSARGASARARSRPARTCSSPPTAASSASSPVRRATCA